MEEEKIVQFKEACGNYFQKVSLNTLRSYGRFIGLQKPTAQKKQDLIEDIIKMLCGEIKPDRNKQGAPVKESVNMDFVKIVEQLKAEYLDGATIARIEEANEEKKEETAVMMHLDVNLASLSKEQKKKFYACANSL